MRNTLILALVAAGLTMPAAAQARTTRAELRHDVRDVHQERHDVARAVHSGNPNRIKAERRELRAARRELHEDRHAFIHERRHH